MSKTLCSLICLEHTNLQTWEIAFDTFLNVFLSIDSEHVLTEIDCSECWNDTEKTNDFICSEIINAVLPDHNSLKGSAWTQSLTQSTSTINSEFVICIKNMKKQEKRGEGKTNQKL